MRRIALLLMSIFFAFGLALIPVGQAHAIVGGALAPVNAGTVGLWTMAPEAPKRNRCGGALIRPQWVLSASHCWDTLSGQQPQARIGLDNTIPYSPDNINGYITRDVVAGYVHPEFDWGLLPHDVLLLKLDSPVPAHILKAMGFTMPAAPAGTVGRIQGWGWPCDDVMPDIGCTQGWFGPVRQLNITVRPDSDCVSEWFPEYELCFAASSGKNEMACFGDSGDPLYTKDAQGHYHVRAVVLYDGDDWSGTSCSSAADGSQGLGVAVDVYPHLSWMYSVMAGQQGPSPNILVLSPRTARGPAWLN